MDSLGKSKGTLTDFKDPFSKNKVDSIIIFIRRDLFDETIVKHSASIKFKNGNTSGQQDIDGKDFADVINKIDSFIENL